MVAYAVALFAQQLFCVSIDKTHTETNSLTRDLSIFYFFPLGLFIYLFFFHFVFLPRHTYNNNNPFLSVRALHPRYTVSHTRRNNHNNVNNAWERMMDWSESRASCYICIDKMVSCGFSTWLSPHLFLHSHFQSYSIFVCLYFVRRTFPLLRFPSLRLAVVPHYEIIWGGNKVLSNQWYYYRFISVGVKK